MFGTSPRSGDDARGVVRLVRVDQLAQRRENTAFSFRVCSEIPQQLQGVDAIYVADGFYLNAEQNRQLATLLIDKKLPSFTVNGAEDVKNGLLATNQSNDGYLISC